MKDALWAHCTRISDGLKSSWEYNTPPLRPLTLTPSWHYASADR